MSKIIWVISSLILLTGCHNGGTLVNIGSPDKQIQTEVRVDDQGQLVYSINNKNDDLISESHLGITIDKFKIGDGVKILGKEESANDEKLSWIGFQSTIHDLYKAVKIECIHTASKRKFYVEVRNYNNGVAFRYIVPSEGKSTIYGESTQFTLPKETRVWYASGPFQYGWLQEYQDRLIEEIKGELLAPPATFKLAGNKGYMSITEAALYNYHGAVLLGEEPNTVKIGFVDNEGHVKTGQKIGMPEEKYWHSVVRDVSWEQEGDITTPWRVVMFGKDLDALVNNNIVGLVNPKPDKKLFAKGVNEEWIKPGKCLWTWLTQRHRTNFNSPELYAKYTDYASELNIQYVTIDEGWYHWKRKDQNQWDIVKEIVEAGKLKNVGIWLWKSTSERNNIPGFDDAEFRMEFMQKCREAGAVGVKVDFLHTENKFTVDIMEQVLIDAAKNKLLVIFHGVNKPTGECRTYPNMLAKEAVRGLECVGAEDSWAPGPSWLYHNTVLPFTRLLAGPADYTPMHFGRFQPKGTTTTHQVASPFMFTSPMTIFAADPEDFYETPAKDILIGLPAQWDETRVLAESKIGEVAAFMRRKGNDAYLIILNGETEKQLSLSLDFLKQGSYQVEIAKDNKDGKQVVVESDEINTDKPLVVDLLSGGGYLMKIIGVNTIR